MTAAQVRRSSPPRRAFLEWAVLSLLLSALAIVLGAMVRIGRISVTSTPGARSAGTLTCQGSLKFC